MKPFRLGRRAVLRGAGSVAIALPSTIANLFGHMRVTFGDPEYCEGALPGLY